MMPKSRDTFKNQKEGRQMKEYECLNKTDHCPLPGRSLKERNLFERFAFPPPLKIIDLYLVEMLNGKQD